MLTGSELRFDIWKKDEDYVDWNKYLEYFRREPAFGKEKSKELEKIYLFLKNELGKEFLSKQYRDGGNLVNHWLWSKGRRYAELKWLAASLDHFKNKNCNYIKLIGKLRSVKKSNTEGIPFILIGDSLRKAGFDVVFEPDTDFDSKPDLKITNPDTDETIYIEVSHQEESDERIEIRSAYDFLCDYFHFKAPLISFCAKIYGTAEKEQLEKIAEQILETKEKAYKEESIIVISKEQTGGVIEYAVAHEKKLAELENLALTKKYGLNNILGQALDLDYTPRLLSKIKNKAKQHNPDVPLIIYVPLDEMYFLFGIFRDLPGDR